MAAHSTLVTGAAGFAGRHLLDLLRTTTPERRLSAWSRNAQPQEPGVEWQQVEITDRQAVQEAVVACQPTHIVHLAGSPHVGQSWQGSLLPLRANVLGTHHVLEAVRRYRRDCRVLVVTSAMIYRASNDALDESAPLEPSSPYGVSKLAQDQLALAAAADDGLAVVVARPFNHAGPRQSADFALSAFSKQIALIEAGLAPAEIRVGNLEAERDVSDVRDVVTAYVQLLDRGAAGRAYNICAGTAHRIGGLLDELIAIARLPVTRTIDPERLRPSDQPRLLGDSTRVRGELDWMPQYSIGATLRDTLDWWRAEVAAGRVVA